MADKIMEIMESGHLRKLDHIGEEVPVLEMFTNIWGAGAKTAQLWYQQVRLLYKESSSPFDIITCKEKMCICMSGATVTQHYYS